MIVPERSFFENNLFASAVIALMAAFFGLLVAWLPSSSSALLGMLVGITLLISITPLSALVFLAVLAPMRTLIATEANINLPLDVGQLFVIVLTVAWTLRAIVNRQPLLRFQWSPVFLPLLGFILAGGLTAFTAWSNAIWLTEWLKWVIVGILALLTLSMARNGQWQWIVFALTVSGVANALIGLYIFFGGSGADHLLINNRFFRAFGTFGQPNPFGGFMGILAPLAMGATWGYLSLLWQRSQHQQSFDTRSALLATFYGLATLIMAAALIASWSRGAWLSFGAAAVVAGVALPRRWWHSLTISVFIALFAFGAWFTGIVPPPIADRINSATAELFSFNDVRAVDITGENFAVVERLAHWQAALNMAESHPWLGVGLGNYEVAYETHRLINWTEPLGHAHNYYLNILAEGGIIGFVAYVTMWIAFIRVSWRARGHPDTVAHAIVAGLLGSWSYLLVHSLTDNLYVNNMFLHMGIMLGLLAFIERQACHNHLMESW